MMTRKQLPALPPILKRAYTRAIIPFKNMESDEILQRLRDYAIRQRAIEIAVIRRMGIAGVIEAPPQEPTDADLARLQAVREILHAFTNPGGALDYLSEPVLRASQATIRKEQKRGTAYDHLEIFAKAVALNYWDAAHGEKKSIRGKIISDLNLQKQNRSTSIESMHRAIERILKSLQGKPDI